MARTSLWANPEGVWGAGFDRGSVVSGGQTLPGGRGEKRGLIVGQERCDDNTYANTAAKLAITGSKSYPPGCAVCHVWPSTCYDVRYHTCVANLVLLPRSLAGLSDHELRVANALQFRSFQLYNWHPIEAPPPTRPTDYPEDWLKPAEMTDAVRKSLAARARQTRSNLIG